MPASERNGGPVTAKEYAQGFREHSLLAKPRKEFDGATVEASEARTGVHVRHKFSRFGNLRVIDLDSADHALDAVQRLRATGMYEYVEPDRLVTVQAMPNDPSFIDGSQWHLRNLGQNGGVAGADIHATGAWDIQSSAPDVIVAMIDSGIRLTHEDLAGNLWTNPGEIAGNNRDDDANGFVDDVHGINAIVPAGSPLSGDPTDDNGHGTFTAGIVGAIGNNAKGTSGVAWKVKLMALKFIGADGSGSVSDEIRCVDYAIAKGANIINASFGSSGYSQSVFNSLKQAQAAGIIVVAAAGNDGKNVDFTDTYPANYLLDNVISVANTDRTDALSLSSNYGAFVELGAPGTSIKSTYNRNDSDYNTLSGTSAAAPMVTGALALLKEKYPSDSYRSLINRVLTSVDPLSGLSGKTLTSGRLNLQKALSSTATGPFNDNFSNRGPLTGQSASARSSNVGASREANEPLHANVTGGASLWWTWTAPGTGLAAVDTAGSSIDTVVAVYTGSNLNALTSIASNDDAPGVTTSRSTFNAVSGTTYQIAVDGKNGATGLIVLGVGIAPPNDAFANAKTVSGLSFTVTGDNRMASRELGEPTAVSDASGFTVWYRWVSPVTQNVQVSALSDDFDSTYAIYTGSSVGSLTKIANGTNGSLTSKQIIRSDALGSFTAIANTTYYIAVDSEDKSAGAFTLSIVDSDWQYLGQKIFTSSPCVAPDGTIYGLNDDGTLVAITASGGRKWEYSLTGSAVGCTPAVGSDGTIYVGDFDGNFYAVTPSGALLWTHSVGTGPITSSPAIAADGTIYAKSDDGFLTALNPDGTQKWRIAFPSTSYSSPAIGTDGTIYLGSDNNFVFALSPADGSQKWKFNAGDQVWSSVALGADDTLYFANLTGKFFAVKSDGTQRWSYMAGNSVSSSPAIGADGAVYFGSYDGKLYALNSDGTLRWTYLTGDQIRASSPVIGADGSIYIGSYDHYLHAVNSNGTPRRVYGFGREIRSSPVLNNGILYVGCNDYRIYAINVGQNPVASNWPMYHENPRRTGRYGASAPVIGTQPLSQVVGVGGSVTLGVSANGLAPLSYQWRFNGANIPGATAASFTLSNMTAGNAGTYTVVVTNSIGSVTSSGAVITVGTASSASRLTNLSVRAVGGSGDQTLIAGFIVNGSGNKTVLIRGTAATLGQPPFNVPGFLADPQLQLFNGSTVIAQNDNWATAPNLSAILAVGGTSVGSATLDAHDSLILTGIPTGLYTAQLTSTTGASGVALVEIFDEDGSTFVAGQSTLVNISGRTQVGTDANILIAGFIINGGSPKKVMIRGLGPTLAQLGVSAVLANPKLQLFSSSAVIAENDDWGTAANLSEIIAVGGNKISTFTLDPRDAVIVVTLAPGAYTAQVSGVGNTTGVALIEVYDLP